MRSQRPRRWSQLALIGALLLASATARANPWTRDQGSFYANLSFSRIDAESFYSPSKEKQPIRPYSQISLGFYAEVGLLDRWLTLTLDGTLYRRASIEAQGRTEGIGDLRIGWWSGLLTAPLRLSAGVLVGIPTGDADPSPDAGTAPGAELIAASLPTGDGEVDVEFKLSLGKGFGGGVWPLKHYAIAEVGYWLRTSGFADAFTYKAELGVQAPYPVIERLWIIARFFGVESFASQEEAASSFSGLGDGVTHNSWGLEAYVRIWRGLGVSAGFDGAFRARNLPAGAPIKFTLSYQR
jgi:hypothetical protein